MATLQTVIDSARYDLRDVGDMEYDDGQLVDYMNRMFVVMDNILIYHDSDILRTNATVTLSAAAKTAALPTRSDYTSKLWYGQRPLEKRSLAEVEYRWHLNDQGSVTGQPNYWSYNAANYFFDITADQEYSLTAYFHQKTPTKVITDDMPYNDLFNEYMRESLIVMAQKAREDKVVNVDQQFHRYFEDIAQRVVMSRKWNPRTYHIEF
jgi:hypothetical protein